MKRRRKRKAARAAQWRERDGGRRALRAETETELRSALARTSRTLTLTLRLTFAHDQATLHLSAPSSPSHLPLHLLQPPVFGLPHLSFLGGCAAAVRLLTTMKALHPSLLSDALTPAAAAQSSTAGASRGGRLHRLPHVGRRRATAATSTASALKAAVFTSSPVPFFAPAASEPSPPSVEEAASASSSSSALPFSLSAESNSSSSSTFTSPSVSYARLPESIVMRFEESVGGEDGEGEGGHGALPSLKAITKRSREALKHRQTQLRERGEVVQRTVEAQHSQALRNQQPPGQRSGAPPDLTELDEGPKGSRQTQREGVGRGGGEGVAGSNAEEQQSVRPALPASQSVQEGASGAAAGGLYRPSSRTRVGSQASPALGAPAVSSSSGGSCQGDDGLHSHPPLRQRPVNSVSSVSPSDFSPLQPPPLPAAATATRPRGRAQSSAGEADDFDESESSEDDGGDGLDEDDASEGSDADYVDDLIDDDRRYIDPPAPPSPRRPHSTTSTLSFHPAAAAQSSLASDTDSAAATTPSSTPALSVETVAAVLSALLTPPSLIRLSTPSSFSPRPESALSLGSPADSSLSASLAPPLLYPALPETSRLHSLLMGHGLSVPHVQQLLALLLLYSVAFHDIVQAMSSCMDEAEGERVGEKERIVVRLWRLFLFALERCEAWTEEERPTVPDMGVAVAERERRQLGQLLASKRGERMRRLKDREEVASERVLHYHRQLLTLSADRVRAEEERRALEAEVEAERGKQRQRNEDRAKRKAAYEEQQRRAKVARERRRMMMEDRMAMDRDAPRASTLKAELHRQLSLRRRDNDAISVELRRATERLALNEASRAELERRETSARAELSRALQEQRDSQQRLDAEQPQRSALYDRLLYEVEKRVKVMGELKGWIDDTQQSEEATEALLTQVEQAEERRAEVEAERREMSEGQREMEANIDAEKAREVQLQLALQQRGSEVKAEELRLRQLRSELALVQTVRAERFTELEGIRAVVRGEERRLVESEERLSMTHHHIEQINADSLAFDRHNYARMKEARLLDKAKATMEVERGERRRAMASFEEQKKAKVREREARNGSKERQVLEWMKAARAAAEAVQSSEEKEAQLAREADSNAHLFDVLATDIEESREERGRLLLEVERAVEETAELREKREKVRAIQGSEDAVLQSLHATHASQQEVKQRELDALDAEGAAVAEEVMGVRRELADVAVQRSAVEAEHQRVMLAMQEELSEVVKEGARHDEEMKGWMVEQREERERMSAQLDAWKAKALDSQREQATLRLELQRSQQRLQQERDAQADTRMQQQIATQNNNSTTYLAAPTTTSPTIPSSSSPLPSPHSRHPRLAVLTALLTTSNSTVRLFRTVLRHLNAALNEAVQEYYTRFQQQQPFRQSANAYIRRLILRSLR